MDELIGVPVVGAPVVAGAGFIALLLVVFTGSWAGSAVAVLLLPLADPATREQTFWVTVAIVCLYAGGRLLFTGTAWPAGVWPFDVRA
jgi:hypothetical protein